MLTLHRATLVLPDPADPTAPSHVDGAVLVRDGLVEAVGPYPELVAAQPTARVRDWGDALLTPGLRHPDGHRLLERAYHPDPREELGDAPVPDGLVGETDEARCGASARRGLQRMLGFGVTAVAGPFERASVRTAVARSGLVALPGAGSPGPVGLPGTADAVDAVEAADAADAVWSLDPLVGLPFAEAVHGRLVVGGRADFAVFAVFAPGADGPRAGGCRAAALGGRLVFRRR
ncbi:imidazolonepropionase-like domain-containing protein [Kitasatospora purpeofusca]|uniref:amidohydrolase family protein n=1 Tax=Kitasatospora purpeofusca TaxID=67352 RepID=UPI003865ACFD